MSFYLSSTPNKPYSNSEINLSLTDAFTKHRSISLTSKKVIPCLNSFSTSTYSSSIQEPNKFHNIKTYSHKFKNVSNSNCFATLPKVSIDLNETINLKEEEVSDLRLKLKELSTDKIKLINKTYIKELKNLREIIDNILINNNPPNSNL